MVARVGGGAGGLILPPRLSPARPSPPAPLPPPLSPALGEGREHAVSLLSQGGRVAWWERRAGEVRAGAGGGPLPPHPPVVLQILHPRLLLPEHLAELLGHVV